MVYGLLFLAAVSETLNPNGDGDFEHRFETRDLFIVAGAAVVIGLLLVLWMVFFRKRRDEHDHPDPVSHGGDGSNSGSHRRRRRRRHRRRDHRPRNPTVGDTGGLPPPRPEDQPPPF